MSEKFKNLLFKLWIFMSAILVIISTLFILIYILKGGMKSINFEFIFGYPRGIPLGSEGGILPAIIGSLLLMAISSIFASILAISTAIYVVFYCKNKLFVDFIHMVIQCISGVPSIVLGMFGYSLLIVSLRINRSLFTAAITLGIMIFPYIEVRLEKIISEVDFNIINSSFSLGVSKLYTIFNLILPTCINDIISTILLAGGYAMGATAPIILTGAVVFAPVPDSLFSPVMALPFHLYILTGEGISLEKAYATASILIITLLLINISSLLVRKKA